MDKILVGMFSVVTVVAIIASCYVVVQALGGFNG